MTPTLARLLQWPWSVDEFLDAPPSTLDNQLDARDDDNEDNVDVAVADDNDADASDERATAADDNADDEARGRSRTEQRGRQRAVRLTKARSRRSPPRSLSRCFCVGVSTTALCGLLCALEARRRLGRRAEEI